MRILKTEVQGLHGDDVESESEAAPPSSQPTAQQAITAQQQVTAQQQIDQLQQQIRDLKETPAGESATVPADHRTQQPT
jgi:hypothetical protein